MRGLQRTDHKLFVTVCHRHLPAANRETNHRIERSGGGVGVGAHRAFGPPIGFRRLAAVAEPSDVGALACVWLLMQSASLLGGWRSGGLAVCAGRHVVMAGRAAAVGGLARRRRGRPRAPAGRSTTRSLAAVLLPRFAGRPLRSWYPDPGRRRAGRCRTRRRRGDPARRWTRAGARHRRGRAAPGGG